MINDIKINDVSDTALWVAYYRARETTRPDALFRDSLATALVGERGKEIADNMKSIARYTEWTVVIRTVIIDNYIQTLIKDGIDTVINLGAGLDTRPYRMALPKDLRWIEVDYPNIIAHKDETLKSETPVCQLKRVSMDLSNDAERRQLFAELGAQTSNALILTEGVVPYLSEAQMAVLARDLYEQKTFTYWITEYIAPEVYRYLQGKQRRLKMQNAPFQFFPANWIGFFKQYGWTPREIRYTAEESIKLNRRVPTHWIAMIFKIFAKKAVEEKLKQMSGFILFNKSAGGS